MRGEVLGRERGEREVFRDEGGYSAKVWVGRVRKRCCSHLVQ